MMPMPGMPLLADLKNEFKKEEREFKMEEHKMKHMMEKMQQKGITSFSDSKEAVHHNGNLHEQETRCVDGKCNEKVMDGKTFDPQAEARKNAAIAAKKRDLEVAAAAKHKAEQAAAEAAEAKRTAEKAAIAEKKAEKQAAMAAQESLPNFADSDFPDSSFPFLAETSSSVISRHVVALVGGFAVGSVATYAMCSFRRGTPASEERLLPARSSSCTL